MIKAVGMFLLLLLKIIGWALLLVLLVLAIALLLLLFVPLRYDVLAKNERSISPDPKGITANIQLRLKVNWLLHFLQVSVLYGPDGLSNQIRVAGIDIPKLLARHAEKKKARQNGKKRKSADNITLKDRSANEESLNKEFSKKELLNKDLQTEEIQIQEIQTGELKTEELKIEEIQKEELKTEKIQTQELKTEEIQTQKLKTEEIQAQDIQKKEIQTEEIQEEIIRKKERKKAQRSKKGQFKQDPQKDSNGKQQKEEHAKAERKHHTNASASKASAADTHQPGIFKKIRMQLQRLHKEYTDETNRHAVGRLWVELLKLLRSYKPRKLKADVSFSLADPSLTGMATGMLSLMPVIYRYPCSIVPDFTSEKLYAEGEISASGKVRIFVFLCSVLRLLRDKKFMQTVRRLMKRGSA